MLANVWKDGDMGEAGNYDELALINKNIVVAIWLYSPDRVNIVAPRLMETLHAHGIKRCPAALSAPAIAAVCRIIPASNNACAMWTPGVN